MRSFPNLCAALLRSKFSLISILSNTTYSSDSLLPINSSPVLEVVIFSYRSNSCIFFSLANNCLHISELEVLGVEEADSIMLRHAAYSEKDGVGVIMFEYTDQDVLVDTLWATNYLKSKLYWRDRISEKIFDLNKAAQRLGKDLIEALPGFHCFTGNDHNAALVYQGEATPFQNLKNAGKPFNHFLKWVHMKMFKQPPFQVFESLFCRFTRLKNFKSTIAKQRISPEQRWCVQVKKMLLACRCAKKC